MLLFLAGVEKYPTLQQQKRQAYDELDLCRSIAVLVDNAKPGRYKRKQVDDNALAEEAKECSYAKC